MPHAVKNYWYTKGCFPVGTYWTISCICRSVHMHGREREQNLSRPFLPLLDCWEACSNGECIFEMEHWELAHKVKSIKWTFYGIPSDWYDTVVMTEKTWDSVLRDYTLTHRWVLLEITLGPKATIMYNLWHVLGLLSSSELPESFRGCAPVLWLSDTVGKNNTECERRCQLIEDCFLSLETPEFEFSDVCFKAVCCCDYLCLSPMETDDEPKHRGLSRLTKEQPDITVNLIQNIKHSKTIE